MRLETLDLRIETLNYTEEMHNYKQLKVWDKSRKLVKEIYELTSFFPSDEKFGLASQLKRAVISISLNIAEGSGKTDKGFVIFLRMAYSSALEVDTILILSKDLEIISTDQLTNFSEKVNEIQKMIYALINKIENR